MQNEYANTKLASIPLSLLLIVSGLFGFVLLVPLTPAHAAAPTVTLSATSGTVASSLTITGLGFAAASTILITSVVGSTTVNWLTATCATAHGGSSGTDSLVVAGCLTSTARGNFVSTIAVPAMPGGAQTITVSDGTTPATAAFTVNPKISQSLATSKQTGFPGTTITDTLSASGFGATESVTFTSTAITTPSLPAACTTNALGSCTSGSTTFVLADTTAGSKTLTGTGGTSGLIGTGTFTVKAWVSFSSGGSNTLFSFPGSAPTSVSIEGHGFAPGTIAANSITLGGVATTHAAITVGSSGVFTKQVVSPNANVPFGAISVVVQGNTFNFANGNINEAPGATPILGGVLISSIAGTGTSTAVGQLDAATHTFGDTVGVMGYGFKPGDTIGITATNIPGVTLVKGSTYETATVDARGAFFVGTSAGTLTGEIAGTFSVALTGSTTAATISPSYATTPSLTMNFDTTTLALTTVGVNYKSTGLTVTANMFAATTPITVTAGGVTIFTGTTSSIGAAGGLLTISGITAGQAPDLAQGSVTATASDGTNTGTDTFVMIPLVDFSGSFTADTVTSGTPGTTTNLRTGSSFGVHGLKANTAYSINWGLPANGIQTLGTFTTTATGGIPVPGVQFTLPTGAAGNHLITLIQGTSDALFGVVLANTVSSLGPSTQYGDLVFSLQVLINVSPTVANVGQAVVLSGSGLRASTVYETTISPTTGSGGATGQIFSALTADASGNVPTGSSLVIPAMPTVGPDGDCDDGAYFEQATTVYIHFSTAAQYPGAQDGQGLVVLAGAGNLNSSSAAVGHSVTMTATGLGNTCTYDIIFNYGVNPQATAFTGQIVGAFVSSSVGGGIANFNVPLTAQPGTYTIQLARVSGPALGILSIPATLTVTTPGATSCQSTTCLTAGTATLQTIGQFQTLVVPFTNTASGQVTGVVYGVVSNSQGQTVYYTTATVTPAGGATTTAYLTLAGLPHGTYTVSYFATNTGGVAISLTGSMSVTL
jgi:hypothetical protein